MIMVADTSIKKWRNECDTLPFRNLFCKSTFFVQVKQKYSHWQYLSQFFRNTFIYLLCNFNSKRLVLSIVSTRRRNVPYVLYKEFHLEEVILYKLWIAIEYIDCCILVTPPDQTSG